jgi:hypothetical protein
MHRISYIVKLAQRVFVPLSRFMRERAGERETGMPVCCILVAALYVSGYAYATDAAPAKEGKAASVAAGEAAPMPGDKPEPHIALLLPLKSAAFGRAAEAVQQGFLAADNKQFPVRVYGSADESNDIVALYHYAVANGARAVAGPLTRNGVVALAADPGITVPTLALNIPDIRGAKRLYFFGLSAEAEARQVAQIAADANLNKAIIVNSGTPLSKRLVQAFAAEWKTFGGSIIKEILYNDDPAGLADLPVAEGNMVFLAADAEKAHLIRPYLNMALPVYATSQLFNGNADTMTNFDLKEVRFVDMPWLLQPDHPAVMVFPRANPPLEADMERLYALGIDAFRLLQILLDNSYNTALPLDGVTGSIQLDKQQFQREAIPAVFSQGRGLTPEQASALAAELAAKQAAEQAAKAGGTDAAAPAIIEAEPVETPEP